MFCKGLVPLQHLRLPAQLHDRGDLVKFSKKISAFFCCLLGNVYGEYVRIIGLKFPGNELDQFGSNKISVLLSEGPKLQNSMIYGYASPGELLFMDLNIPKHFKKYKQDMNICSKLLFLQI